MGPTYLSWFLAILGFCFLKELLSLTKPSGKFRLFAALPLSPVLYLSILTANKNILIINSELLTLFFITFIFFGCLISQMGIFFSISFTYILASTCVFQLLLISDFFTQNYSFIYFLASIVIASDTGGYVFGRLIGGPKPFKKLSAGKTISGYIGGLISCVFLCFFWSNDYGLKQQYLIYCGLILGLSVQFGDLVESFFKRKIGVKDSGNIFPGHGGFLDRFDGFIASVFVAYVLSFFLI